MRSPVQCRRRQNPLRRPPSLRLKGKHSLLMWPSRKPPTKHSGIRIRGKGVLYTLGVHACVRHDSQWWCHSSWSPVHRHRVAQSQAKPLPVSAGCETPQESFRDLAGGSPWSNQESVPIETWWKVRSKWRQRGSASILNATIWWYWMSNLGLNHLIWHDSKWRDASLHDPHISTIGHKPRCSCSAVSELTVLELCGSKQWKCSAVRAMASRRAATSSVCFMFLDFKASASSSPNSRELRVDFLRRDCLLTTWTYTNAG